MAKRRTKRSAGEFWRAEIGGVPTWGIVAALVVIAGIFVVPAVVNANAPESSVRLTPAATPSATVPPPITTVTASEGRQRPVAFVLGDSYTEGAGTDAPAVEGFVPILAGELGWDVVTVSISGGGYVNPGVDGTGPFDAAMASADLAGISPDVVVISGGLNDQGLDAVPDAVNRVIGNVRAWNRTVPIVVVGMLRPEGPASEDFVARTRTQIADTVAGIASVTYIDMSDLTYTTVADGIHPTSEGHALIGAAVVEAIRGAGLVP